MPKSYYELWVDNDHDIAREVSILQKNRKYTEISEKIRRNKSRCLAIITKCEQFLREPRVDVENRVVAAGQLRKIMGDERHCTELFQVHDDSLVIFLCLRDICGKDISKTTAPSSMATMAGGVIESETKETDNNTTINLDIFGFPLNAWRDAIRYFGNPVRRGESTVRFAKTLLFIFVAIVINYVVWFSSVKDELVKIVEGAWQSIDPTRRPVAERQISTIRDISTILINDRDAISHIYANNQPFMTANGSVYKIEGIEFTKLEFLCHAQRRMKRRENEAITVTTQILENHASQVHFSIESFSAAYWNAITQLRQLITCFSSDYQYSRKPECEPGLPPGDLKPSNMICTYDNKPLDDVIDYLGRLQRLNTPPTDHNP